MFGKIISYCMLGFLIIALVLAFVGVEKVEFNDSYYSFFQTVTLKFNNWSFTIPDIPKIRVINSLSWGDVKELITFIVWFGQNFVVLINALISLLNVLILILNTLIHFIQFTLTIIWCVLDFRDTFLIMLIR